MTYIGFDHHKKWTQAAAIDDQAKIIREMRGTQRPQFIEGIPQGIAQAIKGSGRSRIHVGMDRRHAERAWSENDRS